MTAATIAKPRALVSHHIDGWLVGWFAVVVWLALWVAERSGATAAQLDGPIYWLAIVASAMHFGISYHLAYSDSRGLVRRRPVALLVVPAALAVGLATIVAVSLVAGTESTGRLTGILVTSVYVLTMWHYIKQAYGVARLGAAYAHISLTVGEVRILRYGIYPLWLMNVARLLARGYSISFSGYRVGAEVLAPMMYTVVRCVAIGCAVPVAVVFVRVARRRAGWPPALMVAPYAAAFLWLGAPLGYASIGLLLATFHALQYLPCAHRAEVAMAAPGASDVNATRWLELFGGAACGGLLLTTWAPGMMNRLLIGDGKPLLFSAAFFVFLNLHHYLIDAVIWRTRGELVRAMMA